MLWGCARRMWVVMRVAGTLQLLGGLDDASPSRAARHEQLLIALATGLEARDPYTHGHSRRVARHAAMVARRMGLSQHEVAKVRIAAVLHDVGKLATPREILHKR